MLSKIIVGWAALGVALTSATQLRLWGPVGVGETLLAAWMAFFAFCLLRGVRFSYSDAFRPFAIYWAIAAVLLSAGSVVAIYLDELDGPTAPHDALAFAFVGTLTCLLAIRLGTISQEHYYLSLARATFFAISAAGLLLLGASLVTSHLGPIGLWYHGVRFRGWSENPNQLALFMLPMPFLGWYLFRRSHGLAHRVAYLAGIIVCLAVGLATASDSTRVAWAGAAGAIGAWLWFRDVSRGRSKLPYVAYVIVPGVVLALAIGARTDIAAYVEEVSREIYQEGDQGTTRVTAWLNGIDALRHSPLVGFGPGAYSGLSGPFEGFEAHNTYIDWGMSTGLLGVCLLLWLLFRCLWRALRAGAPALLGVALALMIDSVFGYILRQPIYWLLLVLVVTLTEHRASAHVRSGAASATEPDWARSPLPVPVKFLGRGGRGPRPGPPPCEASSGSAEERRRHDSLGTPRDRAETVPRPVSPYSLNAARPARAWTKPR